MPLIKYKFVHDKKYYSCHMNIDQYKNFQELAIVEKCTISNNTLIKESKHHKIEDIQIAILQKNAEKIKKLSKPVL